MYNRRHFLKFCALGSLALTLKNRLFAEEKPKPNVLFILVDDLGWKDLGCYGSRYYKTPNIDRFAKSAMRFTDAYAASPVCSPTRAAIMTGKHPARLNITDWIPGVNPENCKLLGPQDLHSLPLEEKTLAEALEQNGYHTFFAGKWHLGKEGYYPEDQGFDVNKGGHHKGSPPGGYYVPYKNPKLIDGEPGEYLPDRLTDESIKFMEDHQQNPFLIYLSFYTVHTPIQACRRTIGQAKNRMDSLDYNRPAFRQERDGMTKLRQNNAAYASMIRAMDENVGRLLDKLDEFGLADNTIVIFTSDNGGLSTKKKKNTPTSNVPLRAGKGWCYEGGIRVPLIIWAPAVSHAGSKCSEPVISMDFYPTILEFTGIKLMPGQHVDGKSLAPLLRGKNSLHRDALYWHYPHYHGSTWAPGAAVRAGDWKLIEFYAENKIELYNLADDLSEKNDLSQTYPQKAAELADMLHNWQQKVNARLPKQNPNYKD